MSKEPSRQDVDLEWLEAMRRESIPKSNSLTLQRRETEIAIKAVKLANAIASVADEIRSYEAVGTINRTELRLSLALSEILLRGMAFRTSS